MGLPVGALRVMLATSLPKQHAHRKHETGRTYGHAQLNVYKAMSQFLLPLWCLYKPRVLSHDISQCLNQYHIQLKYLIAMASNTEEVEGIQINSLEILM